MTVLHTVLEGPTPHQHAVLHELISRSAAVVTMTRTARLRAIATYGARPEQGPRHPARRGAASSRAPAPRRPGPGVILTWGLLGPGKGIEWGIRALAMLDDVLPRPVYVVAGRTHPQVPERDGEAYRRELVALAASSGSPTGSASRTATSRRRSPHFGPGRRRRTAALRLPRAGDLGCAH